MGYDDSSAGATGVTAGRRKSKKRKAKKATKKKATKKKAKKAKKPCKYGPRDADGYCPKKPSRNPFAEEGDAPAAAPRRKKAAAKKAPARKASAAEKAITKAAEAAAMRGLTKLQRKAADPAFQTAAAGLAGTSVRSLSKIPKAAAVGALSGIALAGIAAFAATTYILQRRARNKEEREQQAYEAALAYREARAAAARQKGAPLTPAENRSLGTEFKATLRRLGISTAGV